MSSQMSSSQRYSLFFFGLCFLLILYVFYRMLEPFLIAIIIAITSVSLFYPNFVRLNRRLKGMRSLSAMLMVTIVTLLIILPLILFFIALFDEINTAYVDFRMRLASGELAELSMGDSDSIVGEAWRHLERYLGIERMDVTLAISSLVDKVAHYLLEHYSFILSGLGNLALNFFVVIFSMFFFFRDGEHLLEELKKLTPLAPRYEDMLLAKLHQVTHATFFGIFVTAICQGIAAGLVFLLLGIQSPILWGTATALCALVPVVGTAAVWVPMAIVLIVGGSVGKGVILLIAGSTVIGLVDNLLRPLIIEEKSGGLHLLLVFFALLGGLLLFGPAGLVIGPLVVALLVTFLEIYKIEFEEELS